MKRGFLIAAALVAGNAHATPADGQILSRAPYLFPSFEKSGFEDVPEIRAYYTESVRMKYDATVAKTDIETIDYSSDGNTVKGFILRKKGTPPNVKLPVIIFNRGGNREFGKITAAEMPWLAKLADKGYVVLATQYRGNDGGTGADEFGGREVNDVLNLVKLAKGLPCVDADRIHMVGHSRGGMETYLALKADPSIKSAAILAGECDLRGALVSRPELEPDVYQQLIPNYAKDKEEALFCRSACKWAQDIKVPVYIFQGRQDTAVDPWQGPLMAQKLAENGRTYKLEMFDGEHNDFFDEDKADGFIDKIDDWFHTADAKPGSAPVGEGARPAVHEGP